jgi:cytosine/adenosine deaminase-related metal-dependent hydrolase
MRARGVRVALGGDNSILGGEEDLLAEMLLCANLHRQPGFETAAPRAEEVLAMATVAGAHAAGFGDTIGRIARGAAADLVLLRCHVELVVAILAQSFRRGGSIAIVIRGFAARFDESSQVLSVKASESADPE